MKRSTLVACLIAILLTFGFFGISRGQAVLYEDFNYTPPTYIGGNGPAGSTSNNWTTHSVTAGQTTTIDVVSGSLSYTGLAAPSGNMVYDFGNANLTSRDVNRAFVSASTVLYYSVLINVIDNSQIPSATFDYFMHFGATSGTSVTVFGGRLGIRSVNTGANFRLGIQNTSGGTPTFTEFAQDLNFGTTYLVVVKYDRGASPTAASLWVNPASLGGTEPSGAVTNNSGTSAFAAFASICIRNNATTPKVNIDEIRVGPAWADVTPTGGASAPTVQASNISFSSITTTGMTASWTNGNGAKRIVIMNTANSFTNPVDGTDPVANTVYTSGEQVVYNNNGSSVSVSGLTASTTYWFRVYEYNGSGAGTKYLTVTATGNPNSQATSALPPTVTTNAATAIGGTTATVNGTVNANSASTVVSFDYGLTTGYGTTVTATQSPVTGNTNTAVSYNLTGLTPNTVYHFRVTGVSSGGTTNGTDLTFTTSTIVPVAVTMPASGVASTSANFNGTITANNASSTVTFDYGITAAYGTTVAGTPSPVTGMTPTPVVYIASGLLINTLYHFRVCATNSAGSSCGNDLTFTTGCPLPDPAGIITGTSNVCQGVCGYTYTVPVIANATSYVWTLPVGATITSGANTNSITVCYSNIAVSGIIQVYGSGPCGNGAPSQQLVITVNTMPTVTLAGPATACAVSAGNVYTTQAGMSNYTWNVSAGGVPTAGGTSGSNTVTVTWNTVGPQTVSVNYTTAGGCTAASPTVYNVTVNARPTPTITGPATVCSATTGNVYTTQAGMTNYTWSVSAGGTITAGGGSTNNTMTVTWNAAGAQSVCVNYSNAGNCSAASPVCYNVTVNARPVPTINGPAAVCTGSSGNVYTTEAGMSAYVWSLSSGGIITSGTGTNTIIVTWAGTGTQTVCINYNNASSCNASTPTCLTVNVNAVPVPVITGPSAACTGSTGNVYTTQAGMTNYLWNVSAGGQVTAGGTTSSSTVTVKWNTAGAQTVSVNYTNAGNCSAIAPTSYPVTVSLTPVPTITGTGTVCVNSGYYNYTTEAGMSGYVWTTSSGGTINYGLGTNQITVTWTTAGNQTVSVNYSAAGGCQAAAPTVKAITVNPAPGPAGTITGIPSVCAGTSGFHYTVVPIPNASTYVWILPAGASITSGTGTNDIVVSFSAAAVSGNITVQGNNVCGSGAVSAPYPVIVVQLPAAAGTITGSNSVCDGDAGVTYSVPAIANATGYEWTLPGGAVLVNGANTNAIIVDFPSPSVSGNISVYGTDFCGNGTASPDFALTVKPVPPAPVITLSGVVLTSSSATGNQWYLNGVAIAGATGQTYTITDQGIFTCIVTLNGCSSPVSNSIAISVGIDNKGPETISLYPNPSDGQFVLSFEGNTTKETVYEISVLNNLGVQIFNLKDLKVTGNSRKNIDLRPAPNGVYTIVIKDNEHSVLKKIIVNK